MHPPPACPPCHHLSSLHKYLLLVAPGQEAGEKEPSRFLSQTDPHQLHSNSTAQKHPRDEQVAVRSTSVGFSSGEACFRSLFERSRTTLGGYTPGNEEAQLLALAELPSMLSKLPCHSLSFLVSCATPSVASASPSSSDAGISSQRQT